MADDWEDEADDWETEADAAPAPAYAGGVKKLDEEEEEEEEEESPINPNSKYYGMSLLDVVKELEKRDTEAAKANAPIKELSAKERRRRRKEEEEKERERRRAEEAMSAAEREESEQEKYARKLEQRRMVEDAEADLAAEMMGGEGLGGEEGDEQEDSKDVKEVQLIEAMEPKTAPDFERFGKAIATKATKYEKTAHYVQFASELVRDLCANLKPEEVKKVNSALSVLLNEKNKAQQSKKKKKGGGKLGGGGNKSFAKEAFGGGMEGGGDFDDLDDFM